MPSPEQESFIYGLVDPFTGLIRYIGKSIRPRERLTNHCNEPPYCHRTKWIQSVIRKGGRPTMTILETVPAGEDWQSVERRWIAYGREQGWSLTNGTDGGDGVTGITGEGKERMLRTWVGRKHRPESLVKIGAASRGRRHTEEYKQFMRETMSVRTFSPEHRARLSAATSRFTPSEADEIKRRIAAGEKIKDIAASCGVHRMTISRINCGHSYSQSPAE